MFLVVHGALGIAVGQTLGTPGAALIGGFVSHALIDIIPHGDSPRAGLQWSKRALMVAGMIDIGITAAMVGLLAASGRSVLALPALAGLAGGVLPDLLQLPGLITKLPIAKYYLRVHHFFHNAISGRHDLPVIAGMALQVVALACIIHFIQ